MKLRKSQLLLAGLFLLSLLLCFVSVFFSFRVLCLLLGIALCFSLCGTLSSLCRSRALRTLLHGLRTALVLVVAVTGVWFFAVQIAIAHTASLPPKETVDFVVVLGAKTNGSRPSQILSRRIDAALEYLHAHPHVPAILCGGMGADETHTEASVMASALIDGGVDPTLLYREDSSTDTEENLKNAQEIIRSLTGKADAEILIVSSGFHLYRAGIICESLGMTPSYLAAEGASEWYWEMNYRIREFCGVITWTLGFR